MDQASSTSHLPTVVLVHGAFADSSSWTSVIQHLQARDVHVTAAANPLRGIAHDSTYVASVIDQIPAPVIAVGHRHSYGGAVISNAASMAKNVVGLVFVAAFAPVAATQRPAAELAFSEPNGRAAWKELPSWAVIPTGDKAAGTDVLRSMAERARATITEVDGSHVIMISQPQVVADVILEAIEHTTSEQPVPAAAVTE
jgi:pimeloyl-ACP methyl ester carboxylesterase